METCLEAVEKRTMKYLSICSGIEAASVAFDSLGWKPLAFSEIEPFPRAVLAHHYPDFTELKDQEFIVDTDLLCGGTPCQAFSVAGLRQSLADDRGNLTLQFVLLADAIDHLRSNTGREPAWILYENVPGVLSTNDNAFGAFLGGLVGRTSPDAPRGGHVTPSTSAWPSDGSGSSCSLAAVLEDGPLPTRYFLSSKAASGILRRAEARGKDLPERLREALELVSKE